MNLENTRIMQLTESGLCLWQRFDGSYFEQNTTNPGKVCEASETPKAAEAQKETKEMKISDCM